MPRRARLHCGLLQAVFVVHIPAAMFSCLAPPLILTGVTRRLTLQSAPATLHRLPSSFVSTPSSVRRSTHRNLPAGKPLLPIWPPTSRSIPCQAPSRYPRDPVDDLIPCSSRGSRPS
ncbi:hypothetical protein BKA56DRAFT_147164 [Ilyonectria sp. MPI-CAGE-AT-0026]|nr:hypothetical protein BKA56DRAFT_147164 [Ilyonectria sp. MPI-CAGE-AT-0026]